MSSNINIFSKNKHIYDNVLKNSSYKQTLDYTSSKNKPKHRDRNITCFNPSYNKSVMSNISMDFLNLMSKNFPNLSSLPKIFNRNYIKVSYSCTRNISQIIKGHNKKNETLINTTHHHQHHTS